MQPRPSAETCRPWPSVRVFIVVSSVVSRSEVGGDVVPGPEPGRRPAGQEGERVGRGGTRFGGVGGQGEAAVGSEFHGFEAEFQIADDGVMEVLGAGAVQADVVGGPAGTKVLAAGAELTDEVGQVAVVRVAPGFGAKQLHAGRTGEVVFGE